MYWASVAVSCHFFRNISPTAIRDIRHRGLAVHFHPSFVTGLHRPEVRRLEFLGGLESVRWLVEEYRRAAERAVADGGEVRGRYETEWAAMRAVVVGCSGSRPSRRLEKRERRQMRRKERNAPSAVISAPIPSTCPPAPNRRRPALAGDVKGRLKAARMSVYTFAGLPLQLQSV